MTSPDRRPKVKTRLDMLLVERGLAPSRAKAQALIMAGEVEVEGQVERRADRGLPADARLTVRERFPYVSRGALKIERAIADFGLPVAGRRVLDVGISTGGFSDYLLKHGAASVIGVDVTTSQVDSRLRDDPRVRLLERNARELAPSDLPDTPDLVVMDLSFISVTKVLPALRWLTQADFLIMVKPQFEAERGKVGKGGVIRDEERRQEILSRVRTEIERLGYQVRGTTLAGVPGKTGNQETFFWLTLSGRATMAP